MKSHFIFISGGRNLSFNIIIIYIVSGIVPTFESEVLPVFGLSPENTFETCYDLVVLLNNDIYFT